MKNRDLVSSIFWIGVGVIFLIGAIKYRLYSLGNPGSGLFPFIAGILLIFSSLIVLVSSVYFRKRREEPLVREKMFPHTNSLKKLLFALFALFAYGISFEYLGFLLTTFLFMVFLLKFIEPQRWIIVLTIALITALSYYTLFNLFLRVQLPKGILGI